ncbi:phospholipase, partial [Streptococcus pyogenes]
CNRHLVSYIKVYRRWMPANVLGVADAIRVYCETVCSIGC